MHARQGDPRLEDIRVARQSLRGEQAAIGQSPDADAFRIHIGPGLQVFPARQNVLVLAVASGPAIRSPLERVAVAYAQAIIDRHYDIALAGEPLVDAVGPVIK